MNFTVSSFVLTETNLLPDSKLWNLLRVNAEQRHERDYQPANEKTPAEPTRVST